MLVFFFQESSFSTSQVTVIPISCQPNEDVELNLQDAERIENERMESAGQQDQQVCLKIYFVTPWMKTLIKLK